MLLHNLKVALRNILKYKVQTLGSILSLAIGMVTLAVVHSYNPQNEMLPFHKTKCSETQNEVSSL